MASRNMFHVLWFALAGKCVGDEFASQLKSMAFNAAWGAANERKHGTDLGSWEHAHAKGQKHLDAFKEAIDDDSIANLVSSIAQSAAWGAANERAFGKASSSQVDWQMLEHDSGKLEVKVGAALGIAVKQAAVNCAWWAANSEKRYDVEAHANRDDFNADIAKIKELAPKTWPVDELSAMMSSFAHGAVAHRVVNKGETNFRGNRGKSKEVRQDWMKFQDASDSLKQHLGKDQETLFNHLQGMVMKGAWGAANERAYGRRDHSAKADWEKFNYHSKEAQEVYKGPHDWNDIAEMIAGAAWGAANERAFGESSEEARSAWRRFEKHAASLLAAGDANTSDL